MGKLLASDTQQSIHLIPSTNDQVKVNYGKDYKRDIDYSKYLSGPAYDVWFNGLNNKATKENYRYNLYLVCEKLKMTTDDLFKFSDDFKGKNGNKNKNVNELTNKLRDLIIDLKKPLAEYDPRSGRVHMMYYSVLSFCNWTNISVNFTHLQKFLPKRLRKGKDKAYTKDEIIKMLNHSDSRSRLIILLFATTGMREEALCKLLVGNIVKRVNNDGELEAGEITIYQNDEEESKVYCTPECYNAYQTYLDKRKQLGEEITDESPVILRRIPKDRSKGWKEDRTISSSTISQILVNVVTDAGLRKLSSSYTHNNRYVNKISVGFRKFAETTMIGARNKDGTHKMNPYIADSLLGHTRLGGIPMAAHYDQSDKFEDYKRVIPDLTFSKEFEFKVKFEQAVGELKTVEESKKYIQQKEKEMAEQSQEMEDIKKRLEYNDRLLADLTKSNNRVYERDSYDIPQELYRDKDEKKLIEYLKAVKNGKIQPKVVRKYSLVKPRDPKRAIKQYKQDPALFEKVYKKLYQGWQKALNEAKKNKDKEKIIEYTGNLEYLKERLTLVEKAKAG